MELHPRLAADCHELGESSCGLLLLHKNASLPWFIVVPNTKAIALYQMPDSERIKASEEWNAIAAWVHTRYQCKRVNVAAIGNLVPQLHLHIIGRREDDPCWPGVVWGHELPELSWTSGDIKGLQSELRAKQFLHPAVP